MIKHRIIGNMTGNSMDAIDLVLTEFEGKRITDICYYSKEYTKDMQLRMEDMRSKVFNKERNEIEKMQDFVSLHNEYITQIAKAIDEMCMLNNIEKSTIEAIGFHGKTLDHNPPSKASKRGEQPYTLQIGSGQMLADLTGIKVIYDFRSDFIMNGLEGAPLVAHHNAHIADIEGDGIYYNGGNTSNFAVIRGGNAIFASDAGPCNEYIDNYIRQNSELSFDKNGIIGCTGTLEKSLLQSIFDLGREYYTTLLPKSGDPAYYNKENVFKHIKKQKITLSNAVYTLEYFAAYVAALALSMIPDNIKIPNKIILFGGGWKNPIVKNCFVNILNGKGEILPEHYKQFEKLKLRFTANPEVILSQFGDYMEARLFADLARYKLENKAWETPELSINKKKIVCGVVAYPQQNNIKYDDMINRAAKGWK